MMTIGPTGSCGLHVQYTNNIHLHNIHFAKERFCLARNFFDHFKCLPQKGLVKRNCSPQKLQLFNIQSRMQLLLAKITLVYRNKCILMVK